MNWIFKNILESLANFIDGIMEMITLAVNDLFALGAQLPIENGYVINACSVTSVISFSLLSLAVAKQIYSVYIMETDGDSDADPIELIERASIAIALIVNNTNIYKMLLTAVKTFGSEMFSSLSDIEIENSIINAKNFLFEDLTKASQGVSVIYILVFLIGVVILCIKGGIRGGELCFFVILFPFFCCDLVTSRRERFNAFTTSYLVTLFGYVIQIFSFRLSGNEFSKYCAGNGLSSMVFSFAFLYLAIKTPKWLEKYVYTTGLGQTVSSSSRNSIGSGVALLRAIK